MQDNYSRRIIRFIKSYILSELKLYLNLAAMTQALTSTQFTQQYIKRISEVCNSLLPLGAHPVSIDYLYNATPVGQFYRGSDSTSVCMFSAGG